MRFFVGLASSNEKPLLSSAFNSKHFTVPEVSAEIHASTL